MFIGEYSTDVVDTKVSLTRENYMNELDILCYVSWDHMDHQWERSDGINWFQSMWIYAGNY